ncbi:hypothetical protein B0293_28710 [Amycolatopsis azurea DSM 43854]|uniref:Uncharacterized protein n=1 Tax=Amycolatopsis azurea DSM 43854 TaxID=1238180 RepID=A0ABX3J836_9PSEU|nr:hypothetical protein B0293_28710 [Amycolatopsis azurea DSM 43854]
MLDVGESDVKVGVVEPIGLIAVIEDSVSGWAENGVRVIDAVGQVVDMTSPSSVAGAVESDQSTAFCCT